MATRCRKSFSELKNIANKLRIHCINATSAANSGHPTSCSSIAEIITVLFFEILRFKLDDLKNPASDRFILSKGHAAPILYAVWAELGLFPVSDLLNLRKIDSDLEGHPTPRLSFIDVATGSLGQGLSVACGMSYVGKRIDHLNYRVYCVVGDGESMEGAIWEALCFASFYELDNLCIIFDINRLGQSDPTPLQHDLETYRRRFEAFGCNAITVDGHDVQQIFNAFQTANECKGKPTCIIAKTLKGKSMPGFEDLENCHGKPLGNKAEDIIQYLTSLMEDCESTEFIPRNVCICHATVQDLPSIKLFDPPSYSLDSKVATRVAYGTAVTKLAKSYKRVIALDGDTKNSTFSESLKNAFPDNFVECFIAEQNLVGVAIGAATRNRTVPFVSTFAAFLSRAFDQIRMGAISQTNANFVGSHCGISIGEDGPSQMGLEDLALFRSIPGCTVFYPSDAVSTENAVELSANTKGICYIRTTRPTTPIVYANNETFEIGKMKILSSSNIDKVMVVGAGVTVHEALKAVDYLKEEGISIRVVDPFTIKPIDKAHLIKNAKECNGIIITVEDHYLEGGLGEAVISAVSEEPDIIVRKLGIKEIPRSGSCEELMDKYGIDAKAIANVVREFVLK